MRFYLILFVLTIFGCNGSDDYQHINLDRFKNYGDTPLEHTVYKGTDNDYHYFIWSNGKSGGKWKVNKQNLDFECELSFPLEKGAFIFKNNDGKLTHQACK